MLPGIPGNMACFQQQMLPSGYLLQFAMERSTIFKFGKPSISMGHLYHGYFSHNQRVGVTNEHGDSTNRLRLWTFRTGLNLRNAVGATKKNDMGLFESLGTRKPIVASPLSAFKLPQIEASFIFEHNIYSP